MKDLSQAERMNLALCSINAPAGVGKPFALQGHYIWHSRYRGRRGGFGARAVAPLRRKRGGDPYRLSRALTPGSSSRYRSCR